MSSRLLTDRGGSGSGRLRLAVVGAVFGVSGASALVYQVAWQRILALQSGVGIYSVAVIVAAFLAGIGAGSYVGGRLSAGLDPRKALRRFAWIEFGIGGFALVSCPLYYDLLFARLGWLFTEPWRAGAVQFLALALPTTLMGMSLPFLVQGTVRDAATASRTIGRFYGINTVGAALGAILAPWLLIRFLGIYGAVVVGAAGNVLAGAAVLAVGTVPDRPSGEARQPPCSPPPAEAAGAQPFGLWLALYTLSGFCALSLEIVWFRMLDVMVKSTAFTFGTVLAIFLLGLGAGSLVGGPWSLRVKRPLSLFLVLQSSLLLYAGAAVWLLTIVPADLPVFRDLVAYWGRYEGFALGRAWEPGRLLLLYLGLPLFLFGPPTLLMGGAFAVLQRAVQVDRGTSGLRVGLLQAGNITGNVAGSLLTGLVFLSMLGSGGAIRLLVGAGLAFCAIGIVHYGARPRFLALTVATVVLFVLLPDGNRLWRRLHGVSEGPALIEEDATGVAALFRDGERVRLAVNGKGHSWLPYGGVHSRLGVLPAVIHPSPARVAIIGLGSGSTAWGVAARGDVREVTVFELVTPELRLLERLAAGSRRPQLQRLLDDGRVRVVRADGRAALAHGGERYDIIEADALRPHSAYSGNLYSVEFFRLCARRLSHGGLMCTWAPTPRVRRSVAEVFPHVLEFDNGSILVASMEPLELSRDEWMERLSEPGLRAYLGEAAWADVNGSLAGARPSVPGPESPVRGNRDLFPRDEFVTPLPSPPEPAEGTNSTAE